MNQSHLIKWIYPFSTDLIKEGQYSCLSFIEGDVVACNIILNKESTKEYGYDIYDLIMASDIKVNAVPGSAFEIIIGSQLETSGKKTLD